MNYYNIAFYYPGPYYNHPDDLSDIAMTRINSYPKQASDLLESFGFKNKHSYIWTDGSLFRYVETELSRKEVQDILEGKTLGMVEVIEVQEVLNTEEIAEIFNRGS